MRMTSTPSRASDRRTALSLPDQIEHRPDFSPLIGRAPTQIKRSTPPSARSWRLNDLALLAICALFFGLLLAPHFFAGWTS